MTGPVETAQGPGALLEAARRRQGLHIAALAAQLKVSPSRLEALEAERWSELPGPTHARALATSVCRVLGIDAAAVLAGMPRAAGAALDRVSAGLNEPVREVAGLRAASLRWGLLLALLLLLAALGFTYWPQAVRAPALSSATELPTDQPTDQPTPVPVSEPASAPSATASAASVALPSSELLPVAVAPVAVAAIAASTAPSTTGLELRAVQGASWVSVVDAAGNSLVSQLLRQGESLSLPAARAPLRVVLGNAPALALSWRGQPQALTGYEQRRVAKLELK